MTVAQLPLWANKQINQKNKNKTNKNEKLKQKKRRSLIHLPNVSIHALHTFFYTFPKLLTRRLSWTIKSFFSGKSFPLLLWNWLLFIVVVEWYYKFVLLSHDKVTWCRMLCHNQPYNAVHNQSTPSPEEDLQLAVETLRSTSSDLVVRQQNKLMISFPLFLSTHENIPE